MRVNVPTSRSWLPRSASAPPPPPGARPSRAGLPQALAVAAAILFSGALAPGQEPAAQPKPAEENKPATYVGSEACQLCHEDIYKAFQKNPHIAVERDKKRGWETRACESCHGPGSKHTETTSAADIRNPAKLAPAETDKGCLSCHLNQPTHVGRVQNSHARNQVSCVACHSIHKSPEQLVERRPKAVNAQCAGCHTAVWASFNRPHKHKLPEGAMSCVDCHNPHGSVLPRHIQTVSANEPGCLKCHGDKRGPFVFEHAPVRLEGCTACHEPHGSANPRMLARHEVRLMCLECHANTPTEAASTKTVGGVPPAFHNLLIPRFQNCTVCHVKIHGSNVDPELLR
ncbi:MAG TPA: DmsE family decaheme c-type cytochrome [Bryobacteraceae bacterium]|nr:DmsE family decaheme c-type cytochrome [Bryobacteraceae bacterium]